MKPRPEDFGIAGDDLRRLRKRRVEEFGNTPDFPFMLWITLVILVITLGVLIGQTPIQKLIGLIIGIVGPGLIAVAVSENRKSEWRLREASDFKDLIRYEKALLDYQNQLAPEHELDQKEHAAIDKELAAFEKWADDDPWPRDRDVRMARMCARRTTEDFWRGLSGREFEAELAKVFRDAGYTVKQTPVVGDAGVDLWIEEQLGVKKIVQCKRHQGPVGVAAIRDLYGTMTSFQVRDAILASVSGFTSGAREFAKGKRIRLMDLSDIIKLQADSNRTRTPRSVHESEFWRTWKKGC